MMIATFALFAIAKTLSERAWLVLVAFSAVAAADSNQLTFIAPPVSVGVGAVTPALRVQRQDDAGIPLSSGQPPVTVALSSSSPQAQFSSSSSPQSVWAPTLKVAIAAGASATAPFFYRDGAVGSATLSAAAPGFPSTAVAVPVLPDALQNDFETGTLVDSEVPPGKFNDLWTPTANLLVASSAAAHRGGYGLRLVDSDAVTSAGGENAGNWFTGPVLPNFYARFWFRLASSSDTGGTLSISNIDSTLSGSPALAEVKINFPGGALIFAGADRDGVETSDATSTRVNSSWHLVEVSVEGLGTVTGTRHLWWDGVAVASHTGLNLTGVAVSLLGIGEPWAERRTFTGEFNFDDERASATPPASHLALQLSSTARAGECVPLLVSLLSSTNLEAGAPYLMPVTLTARGPQAVFHSTDQCSTPLATWAVTAGSSSVRGFVKLAEAGTLSLGASNPDLLPGSAVLVVSADAGVVQPVAVLTPLDQQLDPGATALLDGKGSRASAVGATLNRFVWDQLEGPRGIALPGVTEQALTLSEPGLYRFRLVVWDTSGAQSLPVTARVLVRGEPFRPPEQLSGCHCEAGPRPEYAFFWVVLATAWRIVGLRRPRVSPRQSATS